MSTPPTEPGGPGPDAPRLSPLLPDDPPRIHEYWLDSRVAATSAGVAFGAHTAEDQPVIVVLLSRGAAADPVARDRLAGMVDPMHIDHVLARGGLGQDTGRLARKFVEQPGTPGADDEPPAPWVALDWDGGAAGAREAQEILDSVELSGLAPQGAPRGPNYRLYWVDRFKPGLARLWPLPWPGRYDRAGWVTILVSWLLMLLLAALAVLIAILIFHNAPPQSPQSRPSTSSSSGGGSPQSGRPQSGSPSPSSSPSQSGGSSPTKTPTMSGSPSGSPSPSGSESGGGSPTPSESGSPGGGNSPRSKL